MSSAPAQLQVPQSTVPATSAPVQTMSSSEQDHKPVPFYKKKTFMYVVAAVVVALLMYWWWKPSLPKMSTVLPSVPSVTSATTDLVGGAANSVATISVPFIESNFDVGGGYDVPDFVM